MAAGATRKKRQPQALRGAARIGRALFGLGAATALLVAIGVGVRELARLPVERVAVTGDLQRVSRERLESMVIQSLEGGFLGADLQSIRAPLEELPWVFRVVVKRRWPNSLEIQVTEQLPIARWGNDGFVNHEGEVFRPGTIEAMGELPLLDGPPDSQLRMMQQFMSMQDELAGIDLQALELTMNDRGSLRARLSNGIELKLGRGDMEKKLRRFTGVYRSDPEFGRAVAHSVDLRYPHGLAVAWGEQLSMTGK